MTIKKGRFEYAEDGCNLRDARQQNKLCPHISIHQVVIPIYRLYRIDLSSTQIFNISKTNKKIPTCFVQAGIFKLIFRVFNFSFPSSSPADSHTCPPKTTFPGQLPAPPSLPSNRDLNQVPLPVARGKPPLKHCKISFCKLPT